MPVLTRRRYRERPPLHAEGEENMMSMRKERELMALARAGLSREQIAGKFGTSPAALHKIEKRLGISLGRYVPKPSGRPATKTE